MAASSASTAAAKLLNPRNPALQSLIRRHLLLHPSAAAATPALSLNFPHLEKDTAADSPNRNSSDAAELNLNASGLPLALQWPLGFSAIRIEAARTYVPKEDDYEDSGEDDDLDDEDLDDEDLDEDDVDIQDFSGSEVDDE